MLIRGALQLPGELIKREKVAEVGRFMLCSAILS